MNTGFAAGFTADFPADFAGFADDFTADFVGFADRPAFAGVALDVDLRAVDFAATFDDFPALVLRTRLRW
ncbi:MAG: hypothetical protein SGI86_03150 [Deltaproteobacteria bacterium]|nr:hypothetical protein [Deltaproteobacteria bacterium]